MNQKKIYELHADVCKALGNPLRIEVIDCLQNGPMSFTVLLLQTGGLKSNLSQHLSVMVKKGILNVRKESKNKFYSLSSKKVSQACNLMREVLISHVNQQQALLGKRR